METQKQGQSLFTAHLLLSIVADGKDRDGSHFQKYSLNFSKVSSTFLWKNQKCTMDYKKMIDVLVLNFKAIFWLERRISVYSFGQKITQQQYCDRAPITLAIRDRNQHLPLMQAVLLASLTDTPYFIDLNKLQIAILPALSTLLPFLLNNLFQLLVLHQFHLHPLE